MSVGRKLLIGTGLALGAVSMFDRVHYTAENILFGGICTVGALMSLISAAVDYRSSTANAQQPTANGKNNA